MACYFKPIHLYDCKRKDTGNEKLNSTVKKKDNAMQAMQYNFAQSFAARAKQRASVKPPRVVARACANWRTPKPGGGGQEVFKRLKT